MPPAKTNPDPVGNFDKGQVREVLFPNKGWSPTDPGGLGAFNPFNTGFGLRPGSTGGDGKPGGPGSSGGTRGTPSSYDPDGIGQGNYGLSRPIGGSADGSAENVYGMTGANAATGYGGRARFGVVGGQGGYGSGMVLPEYTGPQFDSGRDVLKAYRRQKRLGERAVRARPVAGGPGVVDGPGGFGPAGGSAGASGGGADVNGYGYGLLGKPGGPSGSGAGGAATGGAEAGGGKPGGPPGAAGASGADPYGKPGGPPPAAASGAGGAAATGGTGAAGAATPAAAGAAGAAAPAGGGAAAPGSSGMGPGGAATGGGAPPGRTPPSYYEAGSFRTPWGELVQDSGGGGNIYRRNGPTDDGSRFYFDPAAADGAGAKGGWKHMTVDEYRGYNNPASFYKDPNQYAQQAGARKAEFDWNGQWWVPRKGTGTYA